MCSIMQNAISAWPCSQLCFECAAVQSACMDWYTVMYTPLGTRTHLPRAWAYTGHRHRRDVAVCSMMQNAISACHAQFGCECAAVQSACMDWYTVAYTPLCTHTHPPQAWAYMGHRHRRDAAVCSMVQNAISACHICQRASSPQH